MSLTSKQVEALTNVWLDLSATSDLLNGESPIDRRAWEEIGAAAKESVKEIEKEFPFLMEPVKDE
jgi:hypothetical protein